MQQNLSHLVSSSSMHDLRRLRAFHAVAERRSFSAAALQLGYAQSVVSHHVSMLERELGVTLVERGSRPVGLTDAGERLRRHAATVLGHVAAAEDELRALAGLQTGTLRIGAFLSACTSFVPPALAAFETAHPDVEVRLEQLEPPAALHRLRAGELDLVVVWDVYDSDGADDGLQRTHLADDPFRVVLPPAHRLARRRELTLGELAGERFNGPPDEGFSRPYRRMLDHLCHQAGFTPDVAYVVHDVAVGRAFVAAGLCVALMPELTVPPPRPDVAVRPVRGVDPFRSVYGAWLGGRRVPAVAPMLRCLADAAAARLR
jgi:DNA-binding transcriptional LysR family regulator